MASSHKVIAFSLCLMLASFGVIVDAGGMMGGMFGGGKHGGHGGLETLLAAGLLAKLLRGGGGGGGFGARSAGPEYAARSAYGGMEAQALPLHYGFAHDHGYGI